MKYIQEICQSQVRNARIKIYNDWKIDDERRKIIKVIMGGIILIIMFLIVPVKNFLLLFVYFYGKFKKKC